MANSKAVAKPAAAPGAANVNVNVNIKVARQARSAAVVQAKAADGQNIVADGSQIYRFDPQARIALIRQGSPASIISNLSSRMSMSKESLLSSLGLSRATIRRKEKDASVLSKDKSERVLGVEMLTK